MLAGVDAKSTYCYLLAAVEHRDAETWGVHPLDASLQGLHPDYTIADAGPGLRADWAIENSLHYVRDVSFAEDACRIRDKPGIFARLQS